MTTQKDPSPEARANVTEENVETRAQLLPEEQAEAILAESEERTIHPDPDDAQGGHRQSDDTV